MITSIASILYFCAAFGVPLGSAVYALRFGFRKIDASKGLVAKFIYSFLAGILTAIGVVGGGILSVYILYFECSFRSNECDAVGWALFPHLMLAIPAGILALLIALIRKRGAAYYPQASRPEGSH